MHHSLTPIAVPRTLTKATLHIITVAMVALSSAFDVEAKSNIIRREKQINYIQ